MSGAIRDCLVTGYEPLIDVVTLPDPNDRHVLAAAIKSRAQVTVTINIKDFPESALEYQLLDAVAEPKPTQFPHPPIWIGGVGRKRTLRMAAEHAAVWNSPAGTPQQVSELSAVLDRHCADIGRDPSEIRRSVQIRVPEKLEGLHEQVRGFVAVGVTEFILMVTADPVAQAERVADILPRLRALAPA
jgi:Luciferase-like monooxygenase